jgi:hypothetical protein
VVDFGRPEIELTCVLRRIHIFSADPAAPRAPATRRAQDGASSGNAIDEIQPADDAKSAARNAERRTAKRGRLDQRPDRMALATEWDDTSRAHDKPF